MLFEKPYKSHTVVSSIQLPALNLPVLHFSCVRVLSAVMITRGLANNEVKRKCKMNIFRFF